MSQQLISKTTNKLQDGNSLIKVHVFKQGEYTSASGQIMNFSDEVMQEIVDSYSSENQAPLTLGHVKNDSPAYGWVKSLEKAKDGVWATVKIAQDVKDSIKNELYKKVSGSLYLRKSPNNPIPGKAKVVIAGAVNAGEQVKSDADGKAVKVGVDEVSSVYALNSGIAGDIIEVFIK
ncbi:MAG: hypothetical protein GY793_04740 [Proteobacteria bacterium]|nr:hypothetical protein [Pseudomonadota bacterium]